MQGTVRRFRASEKPEAFDHLETTEIPVGPSVVGIQANAQQRGNLAQEYEQKFERMSEDQKLSILCSEVGLKLVEKGQHFCTLDAEKRQQMQHLRMHDASK